MSRVLVLCKGPVHGTAWMWMFVSSGKASEMHLIICEVKLERQKRIVPESLGQKREVALGSKQWGPRSTQGLSFETDPVFKVLTFGDYND